MKVSELRVGDWFIYDGRRYIKTKTYSEDIIDVSLESDNFGTPMLYLTIDDGEEVKFLTEFTYTKPRGIGEDVIHGLKDVPNGALCSFSDTRDLYFTVFSGWLIDISTPGTGHAGLWRVINYNNDTPINLMTAGSLKYEEKT